MEYVNVGAYVDNARPVSKAALKRALAADPSLVTFDSTSMFNRGPALLTVEDITPDMSLSVVGPDPYTSRKWYATVELRNGKVKIS